jgi:hypothetical protein
MRYNWIASFLLKDEFLAWYPYARLNDVLLSWESCDGGDDILQGLLTTSLSKHLLQTIEALEVLTSQLTKKQQQQVCEVGSHICEGHVCVYWDVIFYGTVRQETFSTMAGLNIRSNCSIMDSPIYLSDPWDVTLEKCGRACALLPYDEALLLF